MKKVTLTLTLLIALLIVGCGSATSDAIQASGQIEAREILVSPELSGRVVEVLVDEGDAVNTGDPLLRLDDSLLLSEKRAAQAALDSAKANVLAVQATLDSAQAQYDMTLSAALTLNPYQDSWKASKPGEFKQPAWYFSRADQIGSAQKEVEQAKKGVDEAEQNLDEVEKRAGSSEYLNLEKTLSDARAAFVAAKAVLDHTNGASDGSSLHDAAQKAYDDANTNLKNAQRDYDDALTTDGAKDVLKARAEAEVARERYFAAMDALRALQTGQDSLPVVAAGKAVDQAKAVLEQAQSAVGAAQANLDLIDTQLEKLSVRAPMDGVVLVRSIEAGEVIQAGMPAVTIGDLESMKVTVYIPETEYGRISLGQDASLAVDTYPQETFPAKVTRIADKAEFTPQNVQTREGRQTTVYAVELSIENPEGKLKPGMPADVTFSSPAGQ